MAKPSGTLVFDIESYGVEDLYNMPPERFVRLIGYRWKGSDDIVLTTDLEEIREAIRSARWIIGHNIHNFDLRAIFGIRSNEPMQLADEGRVLDTFTHAALVNPIPREWTDRKGVLRVEPKGGWKPKSMRPWFRLDEQAHQLGVPGKTDDLKALADEFGGFGEIPVDDPRYRDYLRGDIIASEAVARALLAKEPLSRYHLREQRIAARAATIESNGFRVDREKAQARADQLTRRREEILTALQREYGLPEEGQSPWSSARGKEAILKALADYGITPTSVDWPKTPAWAKRKDKTAEVLAKAADLREKAEGWRSEAAIAETERKKNTRLRWADRDEQKAAELEANPLPATFGLSFGGKELISITEGTGASELGRALAELSGQRTLAQLALDSCYPDGFVHPNITMLQRSGRWSTTEPGLTVWNSKGEGAIEKSYFIPDNEDHVLVEIDYSNADARVVAWLSGDTDYSAGRFEEDADGHLINARAAWGADVVGNQRDTDGKPTGLTKEYRQKAKALGHGWNYGGQAATLSKQAGLPFGEAKRFCDGMAKAFPRLMAWQDRSRKEAQQGYVMNPWGRKMWVEKGREFTQAPALKGQSGTREVVCDALLRMPYSALRTVKAQVHDALLFSVPRDRWEKCRDYLVRQMETTLEAVPGGQRMEFPVDAGGAGENWQQASHV